MWFLLNHICHCPNSYPVLKLQQPALWRWLLSVVAQEYSKSNDCYPNKLWYPGKLTSLQRLRRHCATSKSARILRRVHRQDSSYCNKILHHHHHHHHHHHPENSSCPSPNLSVLFKLLGKTYLPLMITEALLMAAAFFRSTRRSLGEVVGFGRYYILHDFIGQCKLKLLRADFHEPGSMCW